MDFADFHPNFSCKISGLYNNNFLNLPGIGIIYNFYPLLNIAALPILTITLRNNILDVIPIKQYLRNRNKCLFLIDDNKNYIKGVWSIIISIPVVIIIVFYHNISSLVTCVDPFLGSAISLTIPCILVYFAR